MFQHLSRLLVISSFLSLIECLIVPTLRVRDSQQICLQDQLRPRSTPFLTMCYVNNIRLRSMFIWFTTPGGMINNRFSFYRFVLRSIDELSLAAAYTIQLTNFTELVDTNNSLRLLNLDSGQYEICLEFYSNASWFVYQPRDGCITVRIGESSHASFRQSSTELFITLTMTITLFFILGLVVQWRKSKRIALDQHQQPPAVPRARASSLLSTTSLKKQRDRIVRKLFRRHMDQPGASRMRQWARNRAFRHRISTQEQDLEQPSWTKHADLSTEIDDIYIIPLTEMSGKRAFPSSSAEEFIVI